MSVKEIDTIEDSDVVINSNIDIKLPSRVIVNVSNTMATSGLVVMIIALGGRGSCCKELVIWDVVDVVVLSLVDIWTLIEYLDTFKMIIGV